MSEKPNPMRDIVRNLPAIQLASEPDEFFLIRTISADPDTGPTWADALDVLDDILREERTDDQAK